MVSNYEKAKDSARISFLQYDAALAAKRFGLETDQDFLYFSFLGTKCRLRKSDAFLECEDVLAGKYREADFNEALTVYDILSRYENLPEAKGEFIHLGSMNALTGAASAPNTQGFYGRFSKKLDHREDALKSALSRIGAQPFEGKGDVIAKIPVFQDLSMVLRFWNSDEEFPADLQFLPDAGILSYMHYETVWYMCGALLDRLQALMQAI